MFAAAALAHPIRREVLLLLRERPRTAGSLAAAFSVSRPAVSKHLSVLLNAGLVAVQIRGRERFYTLDDEPLAELDRWLEPFRDRWSRHLDALETEVARTRRERRQQHDVKEKIA